MNEEKEQGKENEEQTTTSSYKNNLMSIIHSVGPLYKCCYVFGIFSFRVYHDELKPPNWKMKTSGMLVIIACIVAFFSTLSLPTAIIGTMNLVDAIDEIPRIVMVIQYVTSAVTTAFLVNDTHIKIFTSFANLDTLLRVEAFVDFYKKTYTQSWIFLTLLIVTHTINAIADIVTDVELSISSLIALPLYFYQKLVILTFCKVIFMLKSRLELINSYLTTFTEAQEKKNVTIFTIRETRMVTEEKMNFIGRVSENNMKIRDLASMYDLMGKICSMINEVFNYQIFMTLMSTFTFIVITIWTSLYYYRTPGDYYGPLINIVIWCFSAIYTVAIMSCACERLLLVRNQSKILVNQIIMNYDLPKTMRVQAKAFMELIEAWPLRIYIYDMFSVDITLMLKFISVATTYLIVIIQISHFV